MVSTKLEWPEDIQEQSSIKKLLYKKMLRKNSQTSEENVFIRVVTCQVPGLELATLSKKSVRYKYFAVKFVKILK